MVWYAVQYKPMQGDRALDHLQRQNVTCLHPKITVQKLVKGRRTERLEPLFPGYLFIKLDTDDLMWSKIRSTRGVARVVSFGGKPAPIDDQIILQIKDHLEIMGRGEAIRSGDKIRIASGPFIGLEAIFDCFDGDERAIVFLNFLQKLQRISIEAEAIT